MSENLPKIDASPKAKGLDRDLRADMPTNAEEFDVLLKRYKAQNLEKYEEKLKNGDLVRQAKSMGFKWGVKEKEEEKEEPKEEKPEKKEVKEPEEVKKPKKKEKNK